MTSPQAHGIVYSRPKHLLGGSDVGMIGKIDGEEHLIKTGISRSLLGQAVTCLANGRIDDANRRLGYMANDSVRLLGKHVQKGAVQAALQHAFQRHMETPQGQRLLEKARSEALDIADVSDLHASLVRIDPTLRNPLGIPVAFDVVNVTAAQVLVNELQGQYLSKAQMPDATLITLHDNALIGSRLLPQAVPMDTFLTRAFLPSGTSLADAKQAAALVNAAKAGKSGSAVNADDLARAQALMSQIHDPENLRRGTQKLAQSLRAQGLDGLFMSLLARLTLGESADLGPDNMLVIAGDDGRNKVVNIDVTGFRFPRENDFRQSQDAPPRHGWGKVIADPKLALDVLLDDSVMSNRYARGLEPVHAAVVSAIRDVLAENATPEATSVREWYASMDTDRATASLHAMGHELHAALNADWMPDIDLINQTMARNAAFITDIAASAQKSQMSFREA